MVLCLATFIAAQKAHYSASCHHRHINVALGGTAGRSYLTYNKVPNFYPQYQMHLNRLNIRLIGR